MKAMQGIRMSYRLQELLQRQQTRVKTTKSDAASGRGTEGGEGEGGGTEPLRGVREEDDNLVSLNGYIYSLVRNNRGQRRALLSTALKMFEDTSVCPPRAFLQRFPCQSCRDSFKLMAC